MEHKNPTLSEMLKKYPVQPPDIQKITSDQYQAIGEFAVQFAMLEYCVSIAIHWLEGLPGDAFEEVDRLPLKRKVTRFRCALADGSRAGADSLALEAEINKNVVRVVDLADFRNGILHACLRSNAKEGTVYLTSPRGMTFENRIYELPTRTQGACEVANRILYLTQQLKRAKQEIAPS